MASFYGAGGGGNGTSASVNPGVIAKEGYSNSPLNLYNLPDGNYNLLGSIHYGTNKVNFLVYKSCNIDTIDGKKYALYTEVKDGKVYDVLIELQSESSAIVSKIEHSGSGGGVSNIINDAKIGENTTYSSKKIEELLTQQKNEVISALSWTTN